MQQRKTQNAKRKTQNAKHKGADGTHHINFASCCKDALNAASCAAYGANRGSPNVIRITSIMSRNITATE